MMQTYNLPYPPSINSLYRHKGPLVYKTKKWKEWVTAASAQLIAQRRLNLARVNTIDYPIAVEMAVGRPDKRIRDLDNLTKVVFDLLQSADLPNGKIIENDHLIHYYKVYWATEVVGIKVIIKSLKPIETGALTDC